MSLLETNTASREHSLLAFNQRVLNLAKREDYPLLERVKFLAIVSSNLDEFFEIRANELIHSNGLNTLKTLKLPQKQSLNTIAQNLVKQQYQLFDDVLRPQLAKEGIVFLSSQCLSQFENSASYQWAENYFKHAILPILTPISLDPAHPFPNILNKSLNFIVALSGEDIFQRKAGIAIVQVPRSLPRVIAVPVTIADEKYSFVMLSTLIKTFIAMLFEGLNVVHCYQFRITRDADLLVDEETSDLKQALAQELPFRPFGQAVRLEIYKDCPEHLVAFLQNEYKLKEVQTFRVPGWVNLVRVMNIVEMVQTIPELKFTEFKSKDLDEIYYENPFNVIAKGDVLLHHPYDSFLPVLHLLQFAASDPQVIAIKQTIYRTGMDSKLMEALLLAAKNGKEVTVVLELMARFDEATNIHWSNQLEAVGVHVVYGVVKHKTHAKMLMIIRQENNEFKRYIHLGTGNYHQKTAKLYTDFGLMTANNHIAEQIHFVFLQLTGLVGILKNNTIDTISETKIWQSPFNLRDNFITFIQQEIDHVKKGHVGLIFVKVNSLLDERAIEKIKEAAKQGVQVFLIIRGACILAPHKNIHIKSIVGRFLEHSRIYYFYNQEKHSLFLSSADLMPRNLDRRIEIAFPILERYIKNKIILEAFLLSWFDTANSTNYVYDIDNDEHNKHKEHKGEKCHEEELKFLLTLFEKDFFPKRDKNNKKSDTILTQQLKQHQMFENFDVQNFLLNYDFK